VVVAVAAAVEGAVVSRPHRVGIGWRPELAASIFMQLDHVDVVEVIAENYFNASRRDLDALRGLAEQAPVHLHGVSLGLASATAVEDSRLDKMARLIERVRAECWSEHLAFVRAGGVEVGHLAMPSRTPRTVEQAVRNIERARAVTGLVPKLENIATLFDPPTSTLSEAEWTAQILRATGAPMLLDLHNLYANAVNDRVESVHLSGGMWISADNGEQRLLDDHVHSPPPEVFELLRALEGRTGPLDVILERDGNFPSFDVLLAELQFARGKVSHCA
jgi:uncharacterized protein (UPF0276 family)